MVKLNELINLYIKDDLRCVCVKTDAEEVYIPVMGKEVGTISAYL